MQGCKIYEQVKEDILSKKEEQEETLNPEQIENPTPEQKDDQPQELKLEDILKDPKLEKHIDACVDEKVSAAFVAKVMEQDEEDEEPQEEKKGIGIFPLVLIGGVLAVGAFTLLAKNSPNNSHAEDGEQNNG
jgi:hypothetical protein